MGSAEFDGLQGQAKAAIIKAAEQRGVGAAKITFRLRDWLISRQRYWVARSQYHCDDCGVVPVPESDLPVELPVMWTSAAAAAVRSSALPSGNR